MILCGGTSGAFVVFRSSFATCIVAAAADPNNPLSVQLDRKIFKRDNSPVVAGRTPVATTMADEKIGLDDDTRETESLVSGILMCVRGVATVCSGLVGKAIVTSSQDSPLSSDSYAEGRWKGLVVFAGVTMAVASIGSLATVRWPKKRVYIQE
jgi:hypothetical protein